MSNHRNHNAIDKHQFSSLREHIELPRGQPFEDLLINEIELCGGSPVDIQRAAKVETHLVFYFDSQGVLKVVHERGGCIGREDDKGFFRTY